LDEFIYMGVHEQETQEKKVCVPAQKIHFHAFVDSSMNQQGAPQPRPHLES
jgi:hypothetical protein